MLRTFVIGLSATVLGVVVWLITASLQLGATGGMIGIGAGLVVGLVDDRSPLARYGAFLVGMVLGILALVAGLAGWIGFLVIMLIFTLIFGLTGGRLPLWAMIIGAGSLAAAYAPYLATAWFALTQFPTSFLVLLATSAGGFMIALLAELWGGSGGKSEQSQTPAQPEFGTPAAMASSGGDR